MPHLEQLTESLGNLTEQAQPSFTPTWSHPESFAGNQDMTPPAVPLPGQWQA